MSSEVKRYWHKPGIGFAVLDPQHYGYESGYVAYEDYEREVRCAIAAAIRMQGLCAALEAECERLRDALECVKQASFDCGNDGWGVIHLTNDDWQIVMAALAASTEQRTQSENKDSK